MYDLLQVMQQDGYLSSGELIALRKTCKELGENPVRVLRSLNIASPEQIQEYLQRYFRVNALGDQAIAMLDEGYQIYMPIDLAIHYSCFGLGEENSVLYVAMEDPSDRAAIQQLRFFLNKRIIAISATVFQLAEALSKIYRVTIPNLRLTTVIEKSRGVIGGLRYEAPFEAEAMTIGEDFAGANLSDADSQDVESFVSTSTNSDEATSKESIKESSTSEPSAEITSPEIDAANTPSSPSVGFIDGSSGEVEAGMLESDNNLNSSSSQEPTSVQEFEGNPESQTSSEEELLSEDTVGEGQQASATEPTEEQSLDDKLNEREIGENEIAQLSALASSAFVKVSMMQNKNQAIELVNSLLDPFKFSVTLNEDNSYQITGEGYSVVGDLSSKIKQNDNPVVYAIDPILKIILKMKDTV